MTKGKIVGGISIRTGMDSPSPEEISELRKMKKAGEQFIHDRKCETNDNITVQIDGEKYFTGAADRKTAKWMIDDIRQNGFLYEIDGFIKWYSPALIESIAYNGLI